MSDIIRFYKINPEEYKNLNGFRDYIELSVIPITSRKWNHLKNISLEIKKILDVGENVEYDLYPKEFLDMTDTYLNIIKEIYDGTILSSEGGSLASWRYHYIIRRNNAKSNKTINSNQLGIFIKNTFIPKIEDYMIQVEKDQNILSSLLIS